MQPKKPKSSKVETGEADRLEQTSQSILNEPLQGNSPAEREQKARERLIRALGNPLEVRLDAELIRDLGVSEREVRAWMDEPDFQTAVDSELVRRRVEARAAVWRALIREALKGSFQHIKLYLELAGDLRHSGDEPGSIVSPVMIIRPGSVGT